MEKGCATHPTITGLFSFSSSSNGVSGATRGSGVQSSTNSSISYNFVLAQLCCAILHISNPHATNPPPPPLHSTPMQPLPNPTPNPPNLTDKFENTNLLTQLNTSPLPPSRTIRPGKKIPHREQEQEKLNRAAHGVVLVAALDVPEEDGRAGDLVERDIRFVEQPRGRVLQFVEVHGLLLWCVVGRELERRGIREIVRRRLSAEVSCMPAARVHARLVLGRLTCLPLDSGIPTAIPTSAPRHACSNL